MALDILPYIYIDFYIQSRDPLPHLLVIYCNLVYINSMAALKQFAAGDLVWAKMKGYPHWPSRVSFLHNSTIIYLHIARIKGELISHHIFYDDWGLLLGLLQKCESFHLNKHKSVQ